MNSEQLKHIANIAQNVEYFAYNAWIHSMTGGDSTMSDKCFLRFEDKLRELNALVERFHMDNENEITSERLI